MICQVKSFTEIMPLDCELQKYFPVFFSTPLSEMGYQKWAGIWYFLSPKSVELW